MSMLPLEMNALLKRAEELIADEPSAQQAVAAWTTGGRMVAFANRDVISGSSVDEAAFIGALVDSGDTGLRYVLCIWRSAAIDVPSARLRRMLMDLNPVNEQAEVLLRTDSSFVVKPMKELEPTA